MKFLVTGGAGFIGSHLCELLWRRGDEVTAIDDLSMGSRENLRALEGLERFTLVVGDVADRELLGDRIEGCDSVFHLAAIVGVARTVADPIHVFETNVETTRAVADEASARHVGVIFTSTSELYGGYADDPFSEDDDVVLRSADVGRWSYARSKHVGESLLRGAMRRAGAPLVIARLFNVAGPRQSAEEGMVVPRFVAQAAAGAPISVYGDGRQSRCFMHVRDCVESLARLAASPDAQGETVNVGNDSEVSVLELAHLVKQVVGGDSEVVLDHAHELGADHEGCRRRVPDLRKLRRLIGEVPDRSLRTIIRDAASAHRAALSLS